MKNRKFVVSSASINSGIITEIDPVLSSTQLSFYGIYENKTYYPIDLQIVNDCGASIQFNIITSTKDYKDYQTDSTYYDFQRIPKNEIVQAGHTNVQRPYKFLIQGYDLDNYPATSDLIIEFLNYQPYNFTLV